jgi:hypothetical protein
MDQRVPIALDNVLLCLSDNGYTIFTLLSDVLSHNYPVEDQRIQLAREELERDALDICAYLKGHIQTTVPVTAWALQVAQSALRSDIEEITKKTHGLCFDARAATAEQIESTFMLQLADKMHQVAPSLWVLVFNLLSALDQQRLLLAVDPVTMDLAEIFEETEQDLGEIGGEDAGEDVGDGQQDDGDGSDSGHHQPEVRESGPEEDPTPPRKRSRKSVSVRNTVIRVIVSYDDVEALTYCPGCLCSGNLMLEMCCVHQYYSPECEQKL